MYNGPLAKFQEEGSLNKFSVSKEQLYSYLNNTPKRLEQITEVMEENKERLDRDTTLKGFLSKYCENIKN